METKGSDSGLNIVKEGSMGRRCEATVNQMSFTVMFTARSQLKRGTRMFPLERELG